MFNRRALAAILAALIGVGGFVAAPASAHRVPSQQVTGLERPPLADAAHAANHRAKWSCVNVIYPYDPQDQRCRAAGVWKATSTPPPESRRKTRTAWFLRGWATNNSFTVTALTVRVRYAPSGPAQGLVVTRVQDKCVWSHNGVRLDGCDLYRP